MTGNLEMAYAPFTATLLGGGFEEPESGGWSAELVAAHVAANNDRIAELAASVMRGEEVSYDNDATIDEDELFRYAERVGGLAGLADEIQRSAARLDQAYHELGELAATTIHVHIRDGENVVYDGPMPIGAFMEGNAGGHLDLHHEQLKTLQRPWIGEPPDAFDTYQLVLLIRGANPPDLDDAASESLQRQHLGHFAKMRKAGYMAVAGPIDGDDDIAGISIYTVRSVEEARTLAEDDPAVRAGRFEVRAMTWYTGKGALTTH